jgi:hypothetical protein
MGRRRDAQGFLVGAPSKIVLKLAQEERAGLKWWAEKYVDNGAYCL